MLSTLSVGNVLDALIPISRFNKGEANKIFEEVRESGYKIVVKNNTPACVLLTPEKYQEIIELLEDKYLLAIAEERSKSNSKTFSHAEIINELNVDSKALSKIEVDID